MFNQHVRRAWIFWFSVYSEQEYWTSVGESRSSAVTLYSDAASSPPKVAYTIVDGDAITSVGVDVDVAKQVSVTQGDNNISVLDAIAALLALWENRDKLRNKNVNLFIDNTAVLAAVLRGSGTGLDVSSYVMVLWTVAARFQISLHLAFAPSKFNIADAPSRGSSVNIPGYACYNHVAPMPAMIENLVRKPDDLINPSEFAAKFLH